VAKEIEWNLKESAARAESMLRALLMLWRGVMQLKRSNLLESGCLALDALQMMHEDASGNRCIRKMHQETGQLERSEAASSSSSDTQFKSDSELAPFDRATEEDEGAYVAKPPPIPPAGKAHRRRHLHVSKAIKGENPVASRESIVFRDDRVSHIDRLTLSQLYVALEISSVILKEKAAPDRSAALQRKTAEQSFSGSRVAIKIFGMPPPVANNQKQLRYESKSASCRNMELSDTDAEKLLKEGIKPSAESGQLICLLRFPAGIWRDRHMVSRVSASTGHPKAGCKPTGSVEVRLEVRVISACSLPQMDTLGTVDAYVRLEYGDQKRSTAVQANTYSPNFNETFFFEVAKIDPENAHDSYSENATPKRLDILTACASIRDLKITIMDYDRVGPHDEVGGAIISGARLLHRVYLMATRQSDRKEQAKNEEEEDVPLFRKGQSVLGRGLDLARLRLRLRLYLVTTGQEITEDGGTGGADGNGGETEVCHEFNEEMRESMMLGFRALLCGLATTPFLPPPGGCVELNQFSHVDWLLHDELLVAAVPFHKQTLTIAAALGPKSRMAQDAHTLEHQDSPITDHLLTTGPIPVKVMEGVGIASLRKQEEVCQESTLLLSDYSLVNIEVVVQGLNESRVAEVSLSFLFCIKYVYIVSVCVCVCVRPIVSILNLHEN